jgi:hypothetical protein
MIIKLDKNAKKIKETFVVPVNVVKNDERNKGGFNDILEWGKMIKQKSNVPALK